MRRERAGASPGDTMKKALAAVGVLVLLALLWFVLGEIGIVGGDAGDGAKDDAAATEDVDETDYTRGRKPEPQDRGRGDDLEDLTAFQAGWPEVGQGREQDPSLGAITGRVLLTPGRPASEAVIEANVRGQVLARVHVPGNGRFLLKNVEPTKDIALRALAPGYAPGAIERQAVRAGQTLDVGRVFVGGVLDPSIDNRIDVRVVTREGEPVANAAVTATSGNYGAVLALGRWEKIPGGTVLHTKTDAQGEASFEMLPPAAYDVLAEADGYTFQVRQRYTIQRDTHTRLELVMSPGMSITGIVVDQDQKPLEGARIGGLRWNSFEIFPPVMSDEEGKFVFKGLQPGSYFLFAAVEGHGAKEMQNVAAGTKDLTVEIAVGAELALRIVDKESGAPITAFGVRPFRNVPFAYPYSPILEATAEDGVFRTRLPPSNYGVEVTAPGYAMKTITSIPLTIGDTEPVDVEMERSGRIHGRVVAKGTGDPVRGAQVFVKKGGFPPTRYKDLQTVTDAEGTFVLDGLTLDATSIWISHVDHTEATFEGVVPVAVPGPDESPTLTEAREFELSTGGRIEGIVYDKGRVPMPGQDMQLSAGFNLDALRNTITDADGRYVFKNVPPGRNYAISVGRFLPGQPGRSKSDVGVADGESITVDFGADAGGQKVTGTVTRDGAPAVNVGVSLISDDGGNVFEQARTDDAGVFEFEGVKAGQYQVTATAGRRASSPVTVVDDAAPEALTLVLVASGLSGSVVDGSTGEPLSGTWVECERIVEGDTSGFSGIAKTYKAGKPSRSDGTFDVEGLEEGSYRLRAFRQGYGTEVIEGLTIEKGETKTDIEIRMGPECVLSGMVRSAAGTPLEGASVNVQDAEGRDVFLIDMTTSSNNGSYTQGSLKPGSYTISVDKDGYAPASAAVTVRAGVEAKQDFTLLQGGRLDVTVRSTTGDAVDGALLVLIDSSGEPVTKSVTLTNLFSTSKTKTDANGQTTIRGVSAGSYRVRATRSGVVATSELVEVFEGTSTAVEITLSAE